MQNRVHIVRLVAVLTFIFGLLGLCGNAASGQAGQGEREYRGSIAIGIHPGGGAGPVCFTLTDPLGRKMSAGPPCEPVELAEIPDAYQDYESIDDDETGAPGPVTRVIFVNGPVTGEYTLRVNLPQDEIYDIEAQAVDTSGGTSHRLITGVKASPDKTDEYRIAYPTPDQDSVLRAGQGRGAE